MSDIVERLRRQAHEQKWSTMPVECQPGIDSEDVTDACNLIEALRAQLQTVLDHEVLFKARIAELEAKLDAKFYDSLHAQLNIEWDAELEAENARLRDALRQWQSAHLSGKHEPCVLAFEHAREELEKTK